MLRRRRFFRGDNPVGSIGDLAWFLPDGNRMQDSDWHWDEARAVGVFLLLLAIILGGLGFAVHVLWWIALVVLVLWLIGFLVRAGEGTARGRWYRW